LVSQFSVSHLIFISYLTFFCSVIFLFCVSHLTFSSNLVFVSHFCFNHLIFVSYLTFLFNQILFLCRHLIFVIHLTLLFSHFVFCVILTQSFFYMYSVIFRFSSAIFDISSRTTLTQQYFATVFQSFLDFVSCF
jgi:hypothetical protein